MQQLQISRRHKHSILFSACILSAYILYRTVRGRIIRNELQQRGQSKKHALSLPRHERLLASKMSLVSKDTQKKILSWTASQIRDNIISGQVSCVAVMVTYCIVCDRVNRKVNALFEKHYDSGIREAEELDTILASARASSSKEFDDFVNCRPLLGVPISVKDVFEMRHSDCTNGILYMCNKPCTEDGAVVKMIRGAGGIPFCKTSVPQLLMMAETWNRIIGHTVNPHDVARSSGGSSGGEGAIIGGGGSILGVGGDIGGSLRIPAHFCGVMAYKPSTRRTMITGKIWCYDEGAGKRYTSKLAILPSVGPTARTVDDLIIFLKAMWSPKAFELDPYSAPIQFDETQFRTTHRLRIGYWSDDNWFAATQCVTRAVDLCAETLRDQYQYELVPMKFERGPKVLEMYLRYILAPGKMNKFIKALRGEELHPQFIRGKLYQDTPALIKRFVVNPLLRLMGEERKAFLMEKVMVSGGLTIEQLEAEMLQILKFRYEFWQWVDGHHTETEGRIDVMLTPICGFPALPLGFTEDMAASLTHTFLQNVLDCAAGSVGPVTFVKEDECHYNMDSLPKGQRDSISSKLNEFMKGSTGLPVNVQVFGRPYDDELVLRVMKELESHLVRKQ